MQPTVCQPRPEHIGKSSPQPGDSVGVGWPTQKHRATPAVHVFPATLPLTMVRIRETLKSIVRVKFRYLLPLMQMALAIAIIQWTNHWYLTVARHYDSPGTPAPFSFMIIMNAPASVVRMFWAPYVDWLWSNVLFVASIGLCWYSLVWSLDSWRRYCTPFPFRRRRLRIAANLLLIAISVVFVGYFRDINIAQMPWQWEVPSGILFLGWAIAPLWICGSDVERCVRRKDS